MKNTILTFIYTGCLFSLLTVSCEKLIEVDLPANQIASGTVFADAQTAEAALAGVYAGVWGNSPLAGDKIGLLLSLYTDDLDFYSPTSTNGMPEVYNNGLIPSNPVVYSQWTAAYQQVYACNAVIEGCEQSETLVAADRKRISGEALLIRSILLFNLQQIFGDIPYPVSTDYHLNQAISRKASAEVLQLLEGHFKESADALEDSYRNSERIYLNKKAAQLMLAKVYMQEQRLAEAETLLKIIVGNNMYVIQNDVTKTFKKTGTNIIWQLKPANNGDATKEAIAYYFDYMPPYNYALSSDFMTSLSANDLRRAAWTKAVTVGGNTWYRPYKYRNLTGNTDEYSVVFRIEEVYLLLAETLAQQNKVSEALPYLNATRVRAALPPVAAPITKSEVLNEILLEDRREFFTETGHRFFDLKRMDRLDLLLTKKPNWKAHHRVWPIPEKELLLNPNLKPQNTGY
ncbi:RagB/SusD family nutrient uptake outer membrane protein [Kaistella palustris]|uniref:RagB/SusD family nutrient uptake outer membrane protein n=1 Tax=Kaistella palustris TaxID=493376 RepID=UPI0003F873FE|nr:RagB/SusD family nutrient uptake outer membrane protein [Kaistella palustris]